MHGSNPAMPTPKPNIPTPSVPQPNNPQPTSSTESSQNVDGDLENDKEGGFEKFSLRDEVASAIADLGYKKPSAIQDEMIPRVFEGRDVIGQAQTGTGKTAAFALPLLSRIDLAKRSPQVLVLAPTRELAIQVMNSFEKYGKNLRGLQSVCLYGGQDYQGQLRKLRAGAQVVVGTPGRMIDHIKRKTLSLSEIATVVLDEADEMLNMGFLEDVKFVLDEVPEERQICLFSATMPKGIRSIARRYLQDPVEIVVKTKTQTVSAVSQRYLQVTGRDKMRALLRILEVEETDGIIIFARTRGSTAEISDELSRRQFASVALNGDVPQAQRERTISQLKSGRVDVLVATDVAARGLDVARISHVINFDLPTDSEVYVHRIGRTGRAGRSGHAISFVSRAQLGLLRRVERATRQPLQEMQIPTAKDVNEKRVAKFKQRISEQLETPAKTEPFKKILADFQADSEHPIEMVAAALASMAQGEHPLFLKDEPKPAARSRDRDRDRDRDRPRDRNGRPPSRFAEGRRPPGRPGPRNGSRNASSSKVLEPGMARFRIQVGHDRGVRAGNIVGAIANEANLDSSCIGRISIFDSYSTVDLPSDLPGHVIQKLESAWVSGARMSLRCESDGRQKSETFAKKPKPRTAEEQKKSPHSKRVAKGNPPFTSDRPKSKQGKENKSLNGNSKSVSPSPKAPRVSSERDAQKPRSTPAAASNRKHSLPAVTAAPQKPISKKKKKAAKQASNGKAAKKQSGQPDTKNRPLKKKPKKHRKNVSKPAHVERV